MATTESAQADIQTCVIVMKQQVEYGRDRIRTVLHSDLCYFQNMAAAESAQTYIQTCVIVMKHQENMAATEPAQSFTQTCVIFMKQQVEYGRDRIATEIYSDMCYFNESVGTVWPQQNPHRFTLGLVLL